MDKAKLGQRLKEARLACQLTQQQVAEHLQIPRTAVVNIENGERALSTRELAELASLFGRSIDALISESPVDEDIFVVLHRLDDELADDKQVNREVLEHVALCREGHDLKELLGISSEDGPPEYHVEEPQSTTEAVSQGAAIAKQERQRLALGNNPLPDLAKLIAAQGIWAAKVALPDEMSGMFLHHKTFGLAILINESHPLSRRRFSFAHEYAHALLDRAGSASISTTKNRKDFREIRANAFAACILLPEEGVRSFLLSRQKTLPSRTEQIVYDPSADGAADLIAARTRHTAEHTRVTYQDVASLMCYFRTSYQAACYRLRSLSLITQKELEELLSKESFAKDAFQVLNLIDGQLPNDESANHLDEDVLRLQVVNLAVEAYRREEISQGRLRDISKVLKIKSGDLLRLAEAA